MAGSFDIDDVLGGAAPPWGVLVMRGLGRRCPRCGRDGVFLRRFRLKDRCEGCGYQFRREPGFALGAWFINFMVLQIVLLAEAMTFIVWKSNRPEAGLTGPILLGVATAIAIPILLYPYAQTVWAGIDLAMTPLELEEIVEAADFVDAERGSNLDNVPNATTEPTTDPMTGPGDDAESLGEDDPPGI
ncbi:MAG: DUF983 domain-containing protein [Aquihabitans sp.]